MGGQVTIIAAVLAAAFVTVAVYATVEDFYRQRRLASLPALGRYTTTLELYATAAGALEPHGVIDQTMAARVIAGTK